jgi:hypothetical protein
MMRRIVCLSLSLALLACLAEAGWADVTVFGYVYYWNLEDTRAVSPRQDPNGLVGGVYRPARRLRIEVEFAGVTIDEEAYTDDLGRFSVTHRDPVINEWLVDVQVRAEVRLDMVGDDATRAAVYEGRLDLWPYNGETGVVDVAAGEEREIDVYIGGPEHNVTSWDYGGMLENHAAFFISQVLCDAYDWLTTRGIAPSEIARDTSIFFPDVSGEISCYNSTLSPPGTAWIDIVDRPLYPDQFTTLDLDQGVVYPQPGDNWYHLRCGVVHEYAHKVMHDVYWAWPRALSLERGTQHEPTACINPELGWVEGWAEFLAGAVVSWPTINGRMGRDREDNIESSYCPNDVELQDARAGSTAWREDVADSCRQENEAENAAVLWDLYDEAGWEYLPSDQQEAAATAGWPAELPLFWHDALSDPDLASIWAIVRDHNPDCLVDESDLWQDSFWYYWKDVHGGDDELMHGLKAILFNRGIQTQALPEHAPERLEVVIRDGRLSLGVSERDPVDRPFLFYNIAYGKQGDTQASRLYETDQPISGEWQPDPEGGSQYADLRDLPYRLEMTGLALPRPSTWDWLVVVVHDSMQCLFATLQNPGGLPDETSEEEQGPQVLPETGEKSSEAVLLGAGVYTGSLGERLGEHGRDLTDWYKVEVAQGTVIRLRLEVPTRPAFNLSLCRRIGRPGGSLVQVEFAWTEEGVVNEIEYVALFSGEYLIDVGMPRRSPLPEGPYTLTIELTPP